MSRHEISYASGRHISPGDEFRDFVLEVAGSVKKTEAARRTVDLLSLVKTAIVNEVYEVQAEQDPVAAMVKSVLDVKTHRSAVIGGILSDWRPSFYG